VWVTPLSRTLCTKVPKVSCLSRSAAPIPGQSAVDSLEIQQPYEFMDIPKLHLSFDKHFQQFEGIGRLLSISTNRE
jgi:hypothetical protein